MDKQKILQPMSHPDPSPSVVNTAINIFIVIAIIAAFIWLIVISSQFAVKHGIIKVESTDISLAEILCIKVIKPRPVNTLVAQK